MWCVLFQRGVLFCVICVFLYGVSYCSTTAIGQNTFAVQFNNNNNNNNKNSNNNKFIIAQSLN
jgi:hypothetical protein